MGDITQGTFVESNADLVRGPILGAVRPLEESMCSAELSVSAALRRGEYGFARSLLVRTFRRLRLFPFIFDYRHLFPPVMVNMIGEKVR